MAKNRTRTLILASFFLAVILIQGCLPGANTPSSSSPATPAVLSPTLDQNAGNTPSPSTVEPTPSPTIYQDVPLRIWFADNLPKTLRDAFEVSEVEVTWQESESDAQLFANQYIPRDRQRLIEFHWVYCLVAPFPTVMDGITYSDLLKIWRGDEENPYAEIPLYMTPATKAVFEQQWGLSEGNQVITINESELLETTWGEKPAFALVPFENLEPRWKVLSISGLSPLDKNLDLSKYALTASFVLTGAVGLSLEEFEDALTQIPRSNFDPQKMTVLIMTGTTALVRYTALRMEENGINYPAQDIGDLLASADITHISNEVPFYDRCPPAEPVRVEQRFCSDPAYFQLLQIIGADVIELTGNHILDWGYEPFLSTLEMYRNAGILYYGGGENIEEAQQVLKVENHGNRLAFIGCSPAGPENVFATANTPGSAPCDFEQIEIDIQNLLKQGYIPIMTFQHMEVEQFQPHSSQRIDFQRIASMGAQIVSGSQSHFPQTMTFLDNHFIHYGLGNLFFDQMYGYNPHEFIDQHYFYDGKYINTVLVTAMLEDFSKPRLMTADEREAFLKDIFDACVWEE